LKVALLAFAILLPFLPDSTYFMKFAISFIFIYVILAIGYDIASGYTGMLTLSAAAMFGAGEYASALVMAAFKMPKATDEEKEARSEAIQEALKEAAELPYETALLCLDVMNMAFDMLKAGNKNAASDASVSGLLGYAALNGALYNVKINLNSIKDAEYVSEMKKKVEGLISESEELLLKIKAESAEIIG
jgi:formiminotetrahydrofolate cyclodeaminase